jgi:hypothetical protein
MGSRLLQSAFGRIVNLKPDIQLKLFFNKFSLQGFTFIGKNQNVIWGGLY